MKFITICAAAIMIMYSCTTPGPITGNPDKSTSTPGTIGSAQMTNQMPRTQTTETRRDADTAAQKSERLPVKRP